MDNAPETSYTVPMRPREQAAPSTVTSYRVPGLEPPAIEKDWENASGWDVAKSALQHAPESALHQVMAIPEAIMNYEQTGQGLKTLGRGALSSIGIGLGNDAEQRASDEAALKDTAKAIVAPYTSWANFKKTMATDPFEVLSTVGMVASGGGLGAVKAGELAAKTGTTVGKAVGSASSAVGKGLEGLSYGLDPTKAVLGATGKLASKAGTPILTGLAGSESGLNKPTLNAAFEAGAAPKNPGLLASGAPAPDIKKAFNDYAVGRGDPVSFSQDASNAFKAMQADEIGQWVKEKSLKPDWFYGTLLKVPVDFTPAYKTIQDFKNQIGPVQGGVGSEVRKAHDVLDAVENQLRFRDSLPPGDLLKSIEGVDQLKRSLYKDMSSASGYASDAYKQAWAGVRKSLFEAAPEYKPLMDKYQTLQDEFQNIQKTLGTGNRVAANAEIAKFIKSFGDANGSKSIEKLAKYDPTLPYKVAGASIHAAAGHPNQWSALTIGQLANMGLGMISNNPYHTIAAGAGLAAQKALLTPQNVAKIPYFAGAISTNPVAQAAGTAASLSRRAATPALMSLQNAEEYEPINPLAVRPGRASGGRTIGHDEISDRLVRMADQVRKQVSTHTEKLLDTPDDHIAKALEIANRDI